MVRPFRGPVWLPSRSMPPPPPSSGRPGRAYVFSTSPGSRRGPFGWLEWAMLSGVTLFWGSAYSLIDLGLEGFAPAAITWVRIVLGFVILLSFKASRRPVERADWGRIAVLGITWFTVPFLLFPIAQQHIDSALAGMLTSMVPIYSTVIASVLLSALPRARQAAGIVLGAAGGAGISIPALGGSESSAWGVMLITIATITYGLSIALAVPLQQRYGAPAAMMRAMGVAAVITMPTGIIGLAGSEWRAASAAAVAALGVFCTGTAFVLMTALVGRVGPTRGAAPIYILPAVAMVIGMTFRGDVIAPLQWAGTALVTLGAWLTSRREA